jgi:hypothetical protein
MGKVATLAAQSLLFLAMGCVRPPISDGTTDLPVHEVVRRLKCELALAIDAKRREDSRFAFLTQWSAKVHLTMVADDTAAFNPGATFLEPLSAGTNRSLAIGGGLSTQAVRTEDIEFFLSFPEMIAEMSDRKNWTERYDYCRRDSGILLESELGLKSVIDKALAPVGTGVLYTGKNNPGIGGGQPKIPAGEISNIQTALNNLNRLRRIPEQPALVQEDLFNTLAGQKIQSLDKIIQQFDKTDKNAQTSEQARLAEEARQAQREKDQLEKNLAAARLLQAHARMLIRDVVNPLSEIAASSLAGACQATITSEKYAATASASVVAVNKYAVDSAQDSNSSNEALRKATDAEKETYGHAMTMLQAIKSCGPKEKPQPALYDPIDIIGETVNFYITYSGSITPSWKLVRVSAPLSSTLFSGTRKNTNTLILTMGRPSVSADGGLVASKAMDNQILSQILSQAITVRTNQ